MSRSDIYKVPVSEMLIGSVVVAWWNKEKYLTALAMPTLVLVTIWSLSTMFAEQIKVISVWLVFPFYVVGFSIFAVTCHRLILVGSKTNTFSISLNRRVLKFAAWIVILYLIYYLILLVPLTILINLPFFPMSSENGEVIYYASLVASIPAMYILARLSLVFPMTAIDKNPLLKSSWDLTRHNGWRIAIIVGLYPWLISLIIWLLSREEASVPEKVIIAFLYYIGCAIEIFALSLTYKEILNSSLHATYEI